MALPSPDIASPGQQPRSSVLSPQATWSAQESRNIEGTFSGRSVEGDGSKYIYQLGKDRHSHRGPPYHLNNSTAVWNR